MFDDFPKSDFHIVGSDGMPKGSVKGIYSAKSITVFDATARIESGDELRRKIPNGTEEAFEVLDPQFHEEFGGIPAHFQVKINRKGAFQPGTGGNYTIQMNGHNARFNLHSTDNSTNTVNDNRVFTELKTAISEHITDNTARASLLKSVDEMSAAKADKPSFLAAYQRFIAGAAEHMTVIAPFLPALAPMLGWNYGHQVVRCRDANADSRRRSRGAEETWGPGYRSRWIQHRCARWTTDEWRDERNFYDCRV
ncbi:hypothetical protein [Neorhizobium sp. DAR64860/K0K1]|uniref:hypothetical protein n=1 Tax=Neorhizobium sp. DAR64860/K0K1 TaxID=3421955 RepID=UPI003D2B7C0F